MLKYNIMWLIILSAVAMFFIWLFNGDTFSHCFFANKYLHFIAYIDHDPGMNCIRSLALAAFVVIVTLPLVLAFLWDFSIWLLSGKKLGHFPYVLWISWGCMVFFLGFEIQFLGS